MSDENPKVLFVRVSNAEHRFVAKAAAADGRSSVSLIRKLIADAMRAAKEGRQPERERLRA
jgi:hypothetical protein